MSREICSGVGATGRRRRFPAAAAAPTAGGIAAEHVPGESPAEGLPRDVPTHDPGRRRRRATDPREAGGGLFDCGAGAGGRAGGRAGADRRIPGRKRRR